MEDRTIDEVIIDAVIAAGEKAGLAPITRQELLTGTRKMDAVVHRNTVIYIMRAHYSMTVERIGKLIKRDHSTVVYTMGRVETRIKSETSPGRTYQYACDILGLQPLVEPMLASVPRSIYVREVKRKKIEREDDYIKPLNYTREEKRRIEAQMKYPGTLIGSSGKIMT